MNCIGAFVAALSMVVVADALAQGPDAQWNRVMTLKPGTDIVVTLRDASEVKRHFVTADASSLVASERRNQQPTTMARVDIIEIRTPKHRGVGRQIVLGTVGYFAGGMAGGVAGMYLTKSLSGLVGIFPGGFVGTLVGVRGGFHRPYEVVYSQ